MLCLKLVKHFLHCIANIFYNLHKNLTLKCPYLVSLITMNKVKPWKNKIVKLKPIHNICYRINNIKIYKKGNI